MRINIGGLLGAAWLVFSPFVAAAAETYYVEIGRESTEEDVQSEWQAISGQYPELLKGLEFHPTTVVHQDNKRIGTRIQAGPLPSKMDAYRICGQLYQDKVPCFIVEGAKSATPLTRKDAEQLTLPWLVEQPQEAVPVTISEAPADSEDSDSGFFSWIFGDDDKAGSTASDAAGKEGEVEVAEAINVPVTTDNKPLYTARPIAERESQPQPVPAPIIQPVPVRESVPAASSEEGVWLTVKAFGSDEDASGFWQAVRAQDPIQTAGFRVRIVRPFMDSGEQNVSLNIGPFAEQGDARSFCHTVIQAKNDKLSCDFATADSQEAPSHLVAPRFEHGKRYEKRRRMTNRSRYQGRQAYVSEETRSKVYWVQVAVAETQMDALKSWDDLREQHPDLLEGLRSSVSATLMRGSKYMVRVGPLESGSAATELCTSLTGRGVPCRIYSNM